MGKDEEKNMFDVENKTELEGAGGAYERTADVSDSRYKTRVFCRGWQVRDFLKEHPGIVATQIVGATSDTIVLEYFEEED